MFIRRISVYLWAYVNLRNENKSALDTSSKNRFSGKRSGLWGRVLPVYAFKDYFSHIGTSKKKSDQDQKKKKETELRKFLYKDLPSSITKKKKKTLLTNYFNTLCFRVKDFHCWICKLVWIVATTSSKRLHLSFATGTNCVNNHTT